MGLTLREDDEVQYARLGSTGMQVSRICLGMMTYGDPDWREWTLGPDEAEPVVTAPIVGASKLAHLEQAVGAVDLELTDDDVERLTEPYTTRAVLEFG